MYLHECPKCKEAYGVITNYFTGETQVVYCRCSRKYVLVANVGALAFLILLCWLTLRG